MVDSEQLSMRTSGVHCPTNLHVEKQRVGAQERQMKIMAAMRRRRARAQNIIL